MVQQDKVCFTTLSDRHCSSQLIYATSFVLAFVCCLHFLFDDPLFSLLILYESRSSSLIFVVYLIIN